jgi:hypothetical protein
MRIVRDIGGLERRFHVGPVLRHGLPRRGKILHGCNGSRMVGDQDKLLFNGLQIGTDFADPNVSGRRQPLFGQRIQALDRRHITAKTNADTDGCSRPHHEHRNFFG